MTELSLACECGKVKGKVKNINKPKGLYVRCFCDDCQAFAKSLDQQDKVLDEYGGTEIYQQALSSIEITDGMEHVACLRLKPDGLFRWYASCCNTPMGNSFGTKVPYFGVVKPFIQDEGFDEKIGVLQGSYFKKDAIKPVPKSHLGKHAEPTLIIKLLSKFARWKLTGKTHPNVFFNREGESIKEPKIIEDTC